MRRKAGALVPLELAILSAAASLVARGTSEFHGYELARRLGDETQRRFLTGYGTLYRALGRLEQMGLLHSRREDPAIAAGENRPMRRFYTMTADGERARHAASAGEPAVRRVRARRRIAPA